MFSLRVSLFLLLACRVGLLSAQCRFMVLDMEIYEPISNVTVYTERGDKFTSNERGQVVINRPFSSVTLSHKGHVPRTLRREELRDTIRLLPRDVTLNEVVITAKAPQVSHQVERSVKQETALYGNAPSGHDFLKFLERNKVRKKIREKARKAVENY